MAKPIVAIVGRPNVGKSTLFNRLIRRRLAIVEEVPGVTRDRLYQDMEWNGRVFTLVDTGGLDFSEDNEISSGVRRQVEAAIAEADLLLFVVDAREGITSVDEEIAGLLRRTAKPLLLVANKVDDLQRHTAYWEFTALGLGEPIPVAAATGLNTGDLLDEIVKRLPPAGTGEEEDEEAIRVTLVGRPNVGKSSLVNAILGQERVLVSSIPGTTRDAVDTPFIREGKRYILVDTAGIRRKSRIEIATERYSVLRALRAIDRSDVVVLVIDATEGVTEQDKRIGGYAHEKGRAVVLAVNKWDLVTKDERTINRYTEAVRRELHFLDYAPLVFTSALTRKRVGKLLELVDVAANEHCRRVPTADLNRIIQDAVLITPPPASGGKRLKIYYATQAGVKPPQFILFVNDPDLMHFSYQRYLENQLRQVYGFSGTPLRFILRERRGERER